MEALQLPTYHVLVPNAVYGQKSKPLDLDIGPVETVHTAILRQFEVPSQAEALSFIVTKAQEAYGLIHTEGASDDSTPGQKTISLLQWLPPSTLGGIMHRDKDALSHLKDHYFSGREQEGRQYLHVTHGIIPKSVLQEARTVGKDDYTTAEAIDKLVMDEWKLLVRLQKSGAFPERQELRYLLDRGVRNSDVFCIQGNTNGYQTVATQMRILYATLTSPEIITGIWNSSPAVMEEVASSTVKELLMCLVSKKIVKDLPQILDALADTGATEGNKPSKKENLQ